MSLSEAEAWVPLFNMLLIVISGVFLLAGYGLIRLRRVQWHHRSMLTASVFAALFLVVYVARYLLFGSKLFAGEGLGRILYLTLLVSHVVIAIAIGPLAFVTIRRAMRREFARHRRLARITLPLWLYVVVTGYAVYVRLYRVDLSPPGQTGYSYPLGSFLWPIGYVYPEQQLTPRERGEGEGEAWTAIRKGTVVRDRSGDEIGVVDDLQFDTNSGRVEGMVIRAGGSIQTFFGGGQTMEIASLLTKARCICERTRTRSSGRQPECPTSICRYRAGLAQVLRSEDPTRPSCDPLVCDASSPCGWLLPQPACHTARFLGRFCDVLVLALLLGPCAANVLFLCHLACFPARSRPTGAAPGADESP